MGLPGFTAAHALYETTVHYQLSLGFSATFFPSRQDADRRWWFVHTSSGTPSPLPLGASPGGYERGEPFNPYLRSCNGAVVDIRSDRANCGACGNDCGSDALTFCNEGGCASWANCCHQFIGFPCPLTPCGSRCVNLQTDSGNCGDCGITCGPLQRCFSGVCRDYLSDPNHCGPNDELCPTDKVCKLGECVSCPAGSTICSNLCIDTATDNQHCGGCGSGCTGDQKCVNSKCLYLADGDGDCPDGSSPCNGVCCGWTVDDTWVSCCSGSGPGTEYCDPKRTSANLGCV
jgi:hypothetical protein